MEESRLRQLKRFLRVYAELSLALFSGLMIAFMLKTPFLANATFLDFTVWANVAHGISMVPHALMSPDYHIKFLTDIPWVILPAVAITMLRRSPRASDHSVLLPATPRRA